MKYDIDSCSIELDGRELCLLALKRGDLDGYHQGVIELPRDEKELFYRLQSEAGAYYNPDVELSNTLLYNDLYYTVSIVADGIIRKKDGIVVDKIKCVKGKNFFAPPDELSLAILKCSAYFVAVRDGLSVIDGRISYYNVENKKLKYFKYKYMTSELKAFYFELIGKISFRGELERERVCLSIPSADSSVFPYSELREGQDSMVRECYSALKRGRRIFVEAPTGTGKTISALFPAVRALGKGYCDKIFYLTPKTATRREAFAAAAKLHSSGVMLRTVVISAKEQLCQCPARKLENHERCSSEICGNSKGYYDRVDSALREMLDNYRGYPTGLIVEMARKYRVCPYELSLDLSEFCDIIICDYNYAFDPSVYFRRYFGAEGRGKNEKYAFLIDEAHNLADRAREMYSAELRRSDFDRVAEAAENDVIYGGELLKIISPVVSAFNKIRGLCRDDIVKDADGNERGFYISSIPVESISRAVDGFSKSCERWIKGHTEHTATVMLRALCAKCKKYITVSEYFDRSFRFYSQISGGDISVRLYCLDPSDVMNSLLNRAVSAVMFSATMTPPEYFCDVLGGGKNAEKLTLPSPFPSENLCVAVADYVNTRFDVREDNARRFATVIAASVTSRPGNYIAYFPSYQCLEQTYKAFSKKYPKVEAVVQKKNMSPAERDEFLAAFKDDKGHMRVGFCVLGGVFSEGVDLPGSRLIGSIIFGVGLPGLSNERNIIKEYFDIKSDEGMGYDYAYTYPGMNNVLQAAGRVIRAEDDRGIVVLADDRYASPKYRELFPEHWKGIKYAGNASSLAEIIRRFWEKQQ